MQVNIKTREGTTAPEGAKKATVQVSSNPKRTRVFIDVDGNEIDPRTKQILKRNNDK